MPVVQFSVPDRGVIPTPRPDPIAGHPKARIVTENGRSFVLPFAPRQVSHAALADTYVALDRPGRKPLTVRTGRGLRTVTFDVFLGYRDHQRSVEPLLEQLRRIAESGDTVTLSLSDLEAGVKWNLTALTVDTLLRQQGTNAVTRANVSLTFTEDVDAAVNVGPLSGGKKKKNKGDGKGGKKGKGDQAWGPQAPGSKGKTTTQRHTVAAGETLASIALLYYGDPNAWRPIAEASGIRDPRKLKVGARLTIPPEE